MLSLFDIITEAQDEAKPSSEQVAEFRDILKAEKTRIPPVIATIKNHFLNSNEFELFEFLDNCEFWECKIGAPIQPYWYATAAVRVNSKGVIEFYYDKNYIEEEAKVPGKLAYLIAHEASHILRYHIDRREKAQHKPDEANIAMDMIINWDIDQTPQIGGWKPVADTNQMNIPPKFHKDYEKMGKKAYYYENMYNWLSANEKEMKKATGQAPPEKIDYYAEGQIVKVNSGSHKGEYRKITKVNEDHTYETEAVDINKEIEKARKAS